MGNSKIITDFEPISEVTEVTTDFQPAMEVTDQEALIPSIPVKDPAEAEKIKKSISNSYIFDMPAGDAYRLYDQLEKGKAERGIDIQKLKGTSTLKNIQIPQATTMAQEVGEEEPWLPIIGKSIAGGLARIGTGGVLAPIRMSIEVPHERAKRIADWLGIEAPEMSAEAKAVVDFANDVTKDVEEFYRVKVGDNVAKQYASAILNSTASSLPLLLAGPTATLPMFGVTSFGSKYQQLRDKGIDPMTSMISAFPVGASEAITEIPVIKSIFNPVTKSVLKRFANTVWREVPGEQINTAIESIGDKLTIEPEMTFKDYLKRALDTFIVTVGQTGLVSGAVHPLVKEKDMGLPVDQMPPDVKSVYEGTVDGLEATGVDSETAHKEATIAISRMESGQEALNQIREAIDSATAIDKTIEEVKQATEITPDIEEAITKLEEVLSGEKEITDEEILGVMENVIGAEKGEITIPETPVAEAEAKPKEPWEMTRGEFDRKALKEAFPNGMFRIDGKEELSANELTPEQASRIADTYFVKNDFTQDHKYFVSQALSEGKSVPAEVLKDYPDLQERIKERFKKVKADIDLTTLPDIVTTGAYHIESGVRKFADWSKVMVKKYGDKSKPYLRDIWKQAQDYLKQEVPTKGVKGLIRETTGIIKDKELSDLSFALIKAARASREAYRAGNKEGIARERARMQEILNRARLRTEELISIKRDIKTLKKIQEKSEGKIALDYQNKIRELLEDIDFAKITEETIERLQGLSDFIAREGVPLGISQAELNQLERLSKTPFRELSKEARENLIETAKKLYDLGKLKRKLQLNKEAREQAKALDRLISSTVNLDPTLSGEKRLTKFDKFKIGFKSANMDVLHSFRQADIADGSKDYQGENARMIKEQMHAEISIKNEAQKRRHRIREKIKSLGIEEIAADTIRKINVVLMAEQGARGQVATLLKKYGFDKVPELDKTERAIVNIVRAEAGAKTDVIASGFEKRENLKFLRVKNYFPIKYEGEFNIAPLEAVSQNRHRTRQVEQGFIEKRLPYVKKAPREDFLAVLEEAILDQEWYIQMQPILDRHNALVRTPEYKAVAGDMMWNWWKDQIDIVARKGWSATARGNPELREIRINLNQAVLGYKISSILMQPFAVFDAIAYTTSRWGPSAGADIATEFSKAWINPKAALEFIEKTPALKLRKAGEIAVEETLEKAEGYKGIWRGFTKGALKGLQLADIITASGVEKGLLKVLEKHGVENAKAEADFLMNLVSGSSEVTIRPHILAKGEGARTWFTFQTFFLNRWGVVSHDILRTGFRGNWKRKATALLGLMIMMAGGMAEDEARKLIYRLTTGKNPKLDESMIKKAILYLPRQIPVIGSSFEEWGTAEPPILRVAEKVGRGIQQISEGKPISGFEKTIEGLMTMLLGIPGTTQMFDFLDYLLAEEKEEEIQESKED